MHQLSFLIDSPSFVRHYINVPVVYFIRDVNDYFIFLLKACFWIFKVEMVVTYHRSAHVPVHRHFDQQLQSALGLFHKDLKDYFCPESFSFPLRSSEQG